MKTEEMSEVELLRKAMYETVGTPEALLEALPAYGLGIFPVALVDALADWSDDFDDGWGDRYTSGDFSRGGFTQLDHGHDHIAKEFRLLRAVRAAGRP